MEYRLEILGATAKMMKFGLFLGAQNDHFWQKKVCSCTSNPHISPSSGPRKLEFEQHLGKMQYYFHVKFGENLRWLSVSNSTLNV